MAYLEEHSYIHRDLAARSIQVGVGGVYKVAEFSRAQKLQEDIDIAQSDSKIPLKWTAPEAVLYKRYTIKSDVWSFGIVMTEIVTRGRSPYPGMTNGYVCRSVAVL